MSILSTTYMALFVNKLTPERIVNFTTDKTLEMPMLAGNEEARKQIEAGRADAIANMKSPVVQVANAVSGFAMAVFGYGFLALIFFVFALAMGGKLHWWQALSATVYAAFPFSVIRTVLNTIILFIKDPTDIHPVLGQSTLIQDSLNFLVTAKDNPVLFSLLGGFSLLGIYWMWLNATGLKNTGEKMTGTIAWTSSIAVYVIIVLLGAAMAFLFPGFIS